MIIGLIRKIFVNDLVAGIFFIIISYLGFLLPLSFYGRISSIVIGGAYYLGGILIANYITVTVGGFSIFSKIMSSISEKRKFLLFSAILGVIFSFIASDLGGLWYFPYWTVRDYWIIGFLLGGWAFYIFFVIACYEAGKLIFDKIFYGKKSVTKSFVYERYLYKILLFLGLVCLLIVFGRIFINTQFFTEFHYIMNKPKVSYLEWQYWIIGFFGIVFLCEYIEHRRHRTSLLKDTLHGYFSPLLSVTIFSIILAITNEIQNLDIFLWKYANYPFQNITFFSVPAFIIFAWPLHFIFFLEFWRAFGTKNSSIIFSGDNIK